MITPLAEIGSRSRGWEQLEGELLTLVRQARADFEHAPAHEKDRAGERYRRALDRFSALVLDRRIPAEADCSSLAD